MTKKQLLKESKEELLNNESSNIVLNREQYERCFYPLVQIFHEKCFSMTCNDYVIFKMEEFLPLCIAGIDIEVVHEAIDIQCKNKTRICGIH